MDNIYENKLKIQKIMFRIFVRYREKVRYTQKLIFSSKHLHYFYLQIYYVTKWIINTNNNLNIYTMNNITSKRFVVRKSLLNTNTNITFTTKKGKVIKYNHDKVFNIMKDTLTKLPCWLKYKSYTATNNIPLVLRDKELV